MGRDSKVSIGGAEFVRGMPLAPFPALLTLLGSRYRTHSHGPRGLGDVLLELDDHLVLRAGSGRFEADD